MFLNTPDRLLSRFFLHLRSVYNDRSGLSSQTAASSIHTDPFGRRVNRLTTGFSVRLETESSTYSGFAHQNERYTLQRDTELAMELGNRYDKDRGDMKLVADIASADGE